MLAGNYGEAGAIDFFGAKHGLPKAISGHNSYYLWGPRGCSGETVVSVGVSRERLEEVFSRIEQVDTVRCRYCMPDEDDLPVYVCRNPALPFEEAWLRFKHTTEAAQPACTRRSWTTMLGTTDRRRLRRLSRRRPKRGPTSGSEAVGPGSRLDPTDLFAQLALSG